jgi:lycopene cyclase domain-containing protein
VTVAYGVALLISLAGMLVIDRRWRLAVFAPGSGGRVLGALILGVGFFVVWDLAGTALGIFFVGGAPVQTGLRLAPELPIEEIGFLLLLCHLALVLAAAAERILDRRREAEA